MKKLGLFILLVCLSACKQIPFMGSPLVEYEKDKNLLTVHNFKWSYGTIGINQFSGDFATLDKEVFEKLKGNSGSCLVLFKNVDKNKYGADSINVDTMGYININELNKFESWEYWHKAGGIKKMIYDKYIARQEDGSLLDSTRTDTVQVKDPVQPDTAAGNYTTTEPTKFSYTDLYPNSDDYDSIILNNLDYEFDGSITEVKEFDEGILLIISIKKGEFAGKDALVMFYPDKSSTEATNRFLNVAKAGNTISAKCVQGTENTLNLISALIYDD
ncbi:hypothetical protein LJ707_16230 [Mucilaginibacter sp. UR6-1]|uniref:hypothetical protein n=1 Tax=Mucilaginibacter sp. UR6-1 TaxID=1435643 RepID=UPI001E34BE6B|nr:hypothetical protein [Mucilaginibacter sp. UR6-1]MCC8410491.1 hypothetical protein [Mucilaginibacter sp. UR6-1]